MSVQVIGIGGEPATGKSSLIRRIVEPFGEKRLLKSGVLYYSEFPGVRAVVLGKYADGDKFGGTDRLSMAVQPDAAKFVETFAETPHLRGWTILFEGDRLFNAKFIDQCDATPGVVGVWFMLTAEKANLAQRHIDRADGQGGTWLKGRETKQANLRRRYAETLDIRPNDTEEQAEATAKLVTRLILEFGGGALG